MYSMKLSVVCFVICISSLQTDAQILSFDTVVSFGDSQTDTGNVYNLTNQQWPPNPPYNQGRFTNGLVWIEKIGIRNIKNYAYGDATIDNNNLLMGFTGPNKIVVPGIRQQIVAYLAANEIGTVDLSRTLYIIWASGTEYLLNTSLSSDLVVATLLTAVYDLLVLQIKHLIIINLPPLQAFPGARKDQNFSALISQHNSLLASNLTQVQSIYTTISIQEFDVYSLINTILSNSSMLKLNKVNKCWNMLNNTILSQCPNPSEYVFIDDYHFTNTIHQIIADSVYQLISVSSVALRTFAASKFSVFVCIFIFIIKKY